MAFTNPAIERDQSVPHGLLARRPVRDAPFAHYQQVRISLLLAEWPRSDNEVPEDHLDNAFCLGEGELLEQERDVPTTQPFERLPNPLYSDHGNLHKSHLAGRTSKAFNPRPRLL